MQFNEFCLAVFWYRLLMAWSILFSNANKIDLVLTACQKIGKNTRGPLELLTSIFVTIMVFQ